MQRVNQLGDSGKKMMPNPRMRTQIKETPIGIRHEPESVRFSVPKLMQLATRIPSVMNN